MAYGESNGHVTDEVMWPRKIRGMTPLYAYRAQYVENTWRCYLATIDK